MFDWFKRKVVYIQAPPVPVPTPCLAIYQDRLCVIHHIKEDGNMGVRPITASGEYMPNLSAHWTEAQKRAIPEEYAVHPSKLRPPMQHEIPEIYK